MYVLTLERSVNLVFEGPTQELIVVIFPLISQDSRVEIGIGFPNPMTWDCYKAKISSLFRKKKNMDLPSPSVSSGKGKAIFLANPHSQKLSMNNCLIWNSRGAKNAKFRCHYKAIVGIHQPSILALLETRMVDHKT